jgi:TRAP-type transport system small permease protein
MSQVLSPEVDGLGGPIGPSPVADTAEDGSGAVASMPRRRSVADRSVIVRYAENLSYIVAWVTAIVAMAFSLGIILCILIQIFYRYALNAPLSWTDETAIFLFAWSTLLLASVAVRERIHVRFTVVANALPARLYEILDKMIMVLIAGFGIALIVVSQDLVELVWGNLSPALHYPLQLLYIAIPIQGALIAIHAVTNVFIGPSVPLAGSVQ